jgi:metal-responsive CopG/Arc/MetJ family transcriptional regulator
MVMSTKKPQILLTLDEDLLERIEDFRYGNRIPSRTEAIRRLIDEALKRWEKESGDHER